MALNVGKEITALKKMTVAGLREKYTRSIPRSSARARSPGTRSSTASMPSGRRPRRTSPASAARAGLVSRTDTTTADSPAADTCETASALS